ncbi:MAG: hypothetical protein GY754_37960 [bacterium]|nr:hypothetical protein [bacterium]
MKYELRPYSFGATIGHGFSMYINNFPLLLIVTIGAYTPLVLLYLYGGDFVPDFMDFNGPLFLIPYVLCPFVINSFTSGVIIYALSKKFLNVQPGSPYNKGNFFSLIPALLGLTLLYCFSVITGLVSLVIPGLILMTGLSLVFNVMVVERKGIFGSFKRSWVLTRKRKWKAFGLMMVLLCIDFAVKWVLLICYAVIIEIITGPGPDSSEGLRFFITSQVLNGLISPLYTCAFIIFYFNRRVEKEGFNIEYLADQFSFAGAAPETKEMPEE